MNQNPFDQLVDNIRLPAQISLSREFEPDLWFNTERFQNYVDQFDGVDIATYSLSEFGSLHNVKRLITGLPIRRVRIPAYVKHKHVLNNHSKIYICRMQDEPNPKVFIGSLNHVASTTLNIMYRVRTKHIAPIVKFFEDMWERTKV